MFTDALVINRSLLTTSIQQDIDNFMNFYSSLNTRLSIAFGNDLPSPHPPRYLMQARKDFYIAQQVMADKIYSTLNTTLQYTVAAPNYELYNKRHEMSRKITQALNIETDSLETFNQRGHSHYQNERLEEL